MTIYFILVAILIWAIIQLSAWRNAHEQVRQAKLLGLDAKINMHIAPMLLQLVIFIIVATIIGGIVTALVY